MELSQAAGDVGVAPTHYEVLGIPGSASEEEVRQAYRRLVKSAHPDLAGDPARFRLITRAYDVLSDPAARAAYDRSLPPGPVSAPRPRRRRRRYGLYAFLVAATVVLGAVTWLVVATMRPAIGDDCLVGTWRSEAFEVPFRGSLDGRNVAADIRGGSGVTLAVAGDGTVRADYGASEPLAGAGGGYRVEVVYTGTTVEQWRGGDGQVRQTGTDASTLGLRATINGRRPDQPVAAAFLDRELPYTCTPTTLEIGPYRYTRV